MYGLRSVRDEDLKEAMQYMHFKDTHGVPPPQTEAPWDKQIWDLPQAHEYIESKPGRCVVVIDDYFVDVSAYLGEHVSRYTLDNCIPLTETQPGGTTLLRKYSVRPEKDLIEASWAFDGGLNNHSRSARKRMQEFRIAQFKH